LISRHVGRGLKSGPMRHQEMTPGAQEPEAETRRRSG